MSREHRSICVLATLAVARAEELLLVTAILSESRIFGVDSHVKTLF